MLPHEEVPIMTSEDPPLTLQRSTPLDRARPTNPSHLCTTTARRHPAGRDRLRAHVAYRGEGRRSSHEAGVFAAKAIPSEPMARCGERSCSVLQP